MFNVAEFIKVFLKHLNRPEADRVYLVIGLSELYREVQ